MSLVPWRAAAAALLALTLVSAGSASAAAPEGSGPPPPPGGYPDRIELPQGWQPEGITTDGTALYVGSLADGRLLRADPRTGRVRVLPASGTGSPAVGVDHDAERRALWVAGGPIGEVRVHRAANGRLLRAYPLPTDPDGRFANDVAVTPDAVYFTDSRNAELGVVPLAGRDLPPADAVETLPLTGDFQLVDGFNLNGIVASGPWLLAVQSATGTLFRIDPGTGDTTAVDLGGYSLLNGDGLELDGDLLYVVRNRDNLVAAVELADDRASGEVVDELTSADFDVPTTAALLGDSLWAVNARFGNPDPANADYWITRVSALP